MSPQVKPDLPPLTLPTTANDITLEWLKSIISKTTTGGRNIIGAKARSGVMFSGGNSSVAIFDLIYEECDDLASQASAALANPPKSVCIKVMPKDSLVPGWLLKRFWKAEVFYYQKLFSSAMGFPQPTCYLSAYEKTQAVIVMNEMTKGRLSCGDSTRDLTYEEACLSVLILARFHAKWWNATDPRLSKLGRFDSSESGITCKFLMGGAKNMLEVEEYAPIHPLVRAMMSKVKGLFRLMRRGPFTLTHGDSRSDNFFYEGEVAEDEVFDFDQQSYDKILADDDDSSASSIGSVASSAKSQPMSIGATSINSDEGSLSAKAALCDFQMIMVSNPMRDYANFVVNSLSPADRRSWNDKLIKLYHAEIIREGVDVGDFTYQQAKIDAKVMTFWPMMCNISIAHKSQASFKDYEARIAAGETLNTKEQRHFNLLKKTRTRLMSAAKDAGLLNLLNDCSSDLPLPFIPCCCYWC